MNNFMRLEILSRNVNEGFARVAVAAFASQLDPTLEELADIKTAVSEAVTNAIIHGYESREGEVTIEVELSERTVCITVSDRGCGIRDVAAARRPLFTTKPDTERSGIGFTVMESFMDTLDVESRVGEGTRVVMTKRLVDKRDRP